MADDKALGGLLGEAGEDSEAVKPISSADAVAVAVGLDAARYDPALARKAGDYLEDQRALVQLQLKHFEQEHLLSIGAAKRKRYADTIRNLLLTLGLGLAVVVVFALAQMVRDAYLDHGLVIEPFSVPPELAQQGITGKVVAARVLDRINYLQSHTFTARPPGSFRNNWGNDIKVEIPETGISVGELGRLLHEQLGHALRIEGDVTASGGELIVTAHVGNAATLRGSGPAAKLDETVQQVAEDAYAATQPYRYGSYLTETGQWQAAQRVFRELADHGPTEERPWAWVGLGNAALNISGYRDSLAAYAQALTLDPNQQIACSNTSLTARAVGLPERALAEVRHCLAIPSAEGLKRFSAASLAWDHFFLLYNEASDLGDHHAAIEFGGKMYESEFHAGDENAYGALLREERVLDHDDSATISDISDLAATRLLANGTDFYVAMPNALTAFEHGDYARTVELGQELVAGLSNAATPKVNQEQIQRRVYPLMAMALASLGRNPEADALLREVADDDYPGLIARARIALQRRDFPGAERALTLAVQQAPSIPDAYSEWGDLLAAKGDAAGAIVKYERALEAGPHYADALKGWGDVLTGLGTMSEAKSKYKEALRYAPNWGALKVAKAKVDQR